MATKKKEKEERISPAECARRLMERDGKVSKIGEYFLGLRKIEPLFDLSDMTEQEKKRFWRLAMR